VASTEKFAWESETREGFGRPIGAGRRSLKGVYGELGWHKSRGKDSKKMS